MGMNLQALIRYRTIDRCLRNYDEIWSWQKLAEACAEAIEESTGEYKKPSRRTIMYDIDNMRSGKLGYHAPIDYDKGEGYFYSDRKFSIHQAPMSLKERSELQQAISIMRQFEGFKELSGLASLLDKVDLFVSNKREGRVRPIIQLEHNELVEGRQWLDQLYQKIRDRETIILEYQPYGKEAFKPTVSPYLIKEFNNRWFLVGWNAENGRIENYACDRILDVGASISPFITTDDFDPQDYYLDIIGVSHDEKEKLRKLVLKVRAGRANYIKTKPIHHSQRVLEDGKEFVTFSLKIKPNPELYALLLSYGEDLEVLKPVSMRKKMKQKLKKAHAQYKS